MIISDDILRRDTIQLLKQIDKQIGEVNRVAARIGLEGYQLQNADGNWPMSTLLLAKTQVYATLVQLQKS